MATPPVASWGRGRQTDARISIAGGRTDFGLDVRAWVDRYKDRADVLVRKIGLNLLESVVLKSPVDTGRFRGNWQVSAGDIPRTSLVTTDKSGTATIAAGKAKLETIRAGGRILLVNNLVYARRLEYGWSKQAPAGMVGITVAEFQAIVDKSVSETK